MNRFAPCQRLLQEGRTAQAREWLRLHREELGSDPLFPLLVATTSETEQLGQYEQAIDALRAAGADSELLFALQRAARICGDGGDRIRQRAYLEEAAAAAGRLGLAQAQLAIRAAHANGLLLDGLETEAEAALVALLEDAIRGNAGLLVISQGTVLCGLMMRKLRWREAASIAVAVEEAAIARKNWIALAAGRMARAGCWHAEGRAPQAVALLFSTGNQLHANGSLAALNLVRARLTELRMQLGPERFQKMVSGVR